MTGRRPSAPPGRTARAGPRWPSGPMSTTSTSRASPTAGPNYLVPAARRRGRLRPAPTPLEPGLLLAVHALQRLEPHGTARPARHERPPLLLRGRRGAALADAPGEVPRGSTPARTAGSPSSSSAWASPARTSRATGCRRSTSTTIGSNQAGVPRRRRLAADVQGHRPRPGHHGDHARPSAGAINPSTSWHPEFDDVNNDGRMDLYVSKGNVDAIPDERAQGPQRAAPRPARRHVPPGGRPRRHPRHRCARAARRSSTSTATGCWTSWR